MVQHRIMPKTRLGRKRRIEKLMKRQLDLLVINIEETPLKFWLAHPNQDAKGNELDHLISLVSLKPSNHTENSHRELTQRTTMMNRELK
jgi:hypothetical protein